MEANLLVAADSGPAKEIRRNMDFIFIRGSAGDRVTIDTALAARAAASLANKFDSHAPLSKARWRVANGGVSCRLANRREDDETYPGVRTTIPFGHGELTFKIAMIPKTGEIIRYVSYSDDETPDECNQLEMVERFHHQKGRVTTVVKAIFGNRKGYACLTVHHTFQFENRATLAQPVNAHLMAGGLRQLFNCTSNNVPMETARTMVELAKREL
ncbi:hypothetical protein CO112_02685 [Candidatus Dojkabacteria bacterium CG_4_9_14_3_um_filter_150_Dojkabacteria_WS6_41_13]|uniref:Uncharacterized protein n=1 Tax=Candidatus Dojkabacteria bacterium CG_4_10_14_0_2_um_filter_Dojkabacteria_WS6_41_15 TaxID=2014249 RepID=A0A2M7W0Z5_9BACT|nr:MAG: hypothetical protein COZ14_00525 [Candidatus Dojkabacteria bacterium CG_4_10_14_3_um_filter_Dojkabacteria_WS6_41_9]PJA12625.1 MAG: hypothetical protein COX64_04320 [Candidatus Dojkabacteria bacterium CG_4_10_14_0_2_um_filter_Dojkabacteria_WS6_41_15]PJB22747.1 MAG: hypothetical protein CO112_02685 [Candidatus Dojkabacteria bacterium CG_4_9_14_3_um_filter_150_Dojkabacteria_WS6_41_13]